MSPRASAAAEKLLDECDDLELPIRIETADEAGIHVRGANGEQISLALLNNRRSLIEQFVQGLRFDFASLPLLAKGESKEVRGLSPRVSVAKLIPSVYSYTNNRYGFAPGTERVRTHFCAEIFREMSRHPGKRHLSTAFIGLVEQADSPLLVERHVRASNLEVRVKRYHIGSPTHRYKFTETFQTAHGGPPLARWTRFEKPVVCFDWRHPLHDLDGTRLADEPLPDDYAAVWIDDLNAAKTLARDAFEWLEVRFDAKGLKLIDICFFIDRSGTSIFGEISPDCMRVRSRASDDADALDKDEWRQGGDANSVLRRYASLYERIFDQRQDR
ncbi:phosphoribosylaminoimidazolesuccinocarboxamide synthase [Bradyrhizobium sp. CB1717]|uniref:phosphoribosylaminoimidazolesuccinocarboxamide synthase n=1 Tax=Bradyrhizobium sp. CB1717 TaxID=3039154 RepID=UPI0024B22016|nr:phosphoribosylaminoimidazolesuccinocarboxamide synthase [Bradyrhizobium sp. CB1717]WFU25145.1 phosphoribosylaminoimidazolesuccinocarboxamide synthase [Bradyrhizobium sp. CB1717]